MTPKQAIVVIHGMGEQRPVETLNRFSRVITPEGMTFYSKVDRLTDSFEARRHLIPPQPGLGTQTEIYEYHWAHLMHGNKLGDLFPLLRRMLLPVPGWWGAPLTLLSVIAAFVLVVSLRDPSHLEVSGVMQISLGLVAAVGIGFVIRFVPIGLIVLWLILWVGIGLLTWAIVWGPLKGVLSEFTVSNAVKAVITSGSAAVIVTFLISRALPNWLTSSFVDVVRYLDTSPRSYEVRKEIRAGVVDLLQALHDDGRYQRIVVIAHSLGSYIAYDAISYLWAEMAKLHSGPLLSGAAAGGCAGGDQPVGLLELERAASGLKDDLVTADAYQTAQRVLWTGLRRHGNPWLITDFISFGSPMYFAHTLFTRTRARFDEGVIRQELPTSPPQNEAKPCNNVNNQEKFFSWNNGGKRVLNDAAPFAVVRWTNLWYPAVAGFFGDWFGGRLAPLFGKGIRDVAVTGNRPFRWVPGAAHAMYLGFPDDCREGSFTEVLAGALNINAASWFPNDTPDYDPATSTRLNDPEDSLT
jgi:hypothetical protein